MTPAELIGVYDLMRSLERNKPTAAELIAKASTRRVKDEIKEVSLKGWSSIPLKSEKKKNYWKKSTTKYKSCPQRAKKDNDKGWHAEKRNERKNSKPIPKGVIVHRDGSWDFEDF